MKRHTTLLILLFFTLHTAVAQPAGVDPFFDAVPFRTDDNNRLFLTNQNASVVKTFFEGQRNFKPARILKMDHGYYKGYRIYYSNITDPENGPEPWIQIFTVNTRECIESFERNNPGLLEAPFLRIKSASLKYGYSDEDVKDLMNQYKQIATKYYREFEAGNSNYKVNEMNLVFQKYLSKLELETGQMVVTGGIGYISKPISSKEYSWELWESCYQEIDQVGYSTLIEYSEVPVSGNRL